MIVTNIEHFRDPFILVENNTYYVYGTAVVKDDWENTKWACYKNTDGKLDGEWKPLEKQLYVTPDSAVKNFWSPEVHKYNGFYYMFATYFSSETNRRGCSILKSDSPEGPFKEISDGCVTPKNWDSLDGTLYIDENKQPWMVFCHEWVCTDDRVGRMAVAKLSDDLTHFTSEPIELFRADAPEWTDHPITDGCSIHKTKKGDLLMLWSNVSPLGYCVGVARSKNGKIDGEWEHDKEILFSKLTTGNYDGGCGIIFTGLDGVTYLSAHSPNHATDECGEKVVFVQISEEDGKLICKP